MFLQVMAVDQESGEAAFAIVVVEVLAEGQLGTETPSHPESWQISAWSWWTLCLCQLQFPTVHWQRSARSAALWGKRCSSARSSWLFLDVSFPWWCGWRRSTGERGTRWRGAAWPRANTQMWWEVNLWYFQLVFVLMNEELLNCSLPLSLPQSLRWFQLVSVWSSTEAYNNLPSVFLVQDLPNLSGQFI